MNETINKKTSAHLRSNVFWKKQRTLPVVTEDNVIRRPELALHHPLSKSFEYGKIIPTHIHTRMLLLMGGIIGDDETVSKNFFISHRESE